MRDLGLEWEKADERGARAETSGLYSGRGDSNRIKARK